MIGDDGMDNISNNGIINVRVDNELKQKANDLFNSLGLNMSTAINMFLSKCINENGIPFEVKAPKPSRRLRKALKEADKMMKHPEKYKAYHNVDEMFKDILNED